MPALGPASSASDVLSLLRTPGINSSSSSSSTSSSSSSSCRSSSSSSSSSSRLVVVVVGVLVVVISHKYYSLVVINSGQFQHLMPMANGPPFQVTSGNVYIMIASCSQQ
jgi:hypothetical protein